MDKIIKESIDKCKELLSNLEMIASRLDSQENASSTEDRGPIALDIFDDYIYMDDKVIRVKYNDKRHKYITIYANPISFNFSDYNGAIRKNVILKSTFDKLKSSGKVFVSKDPLFWHIER